MNHKNEDEMAAEYDFRGKKGVRGKYYEAVCKGHQTVIHKSDGSTVVRTSRPIYLDDDVQKYFPDSESVNQTLRGLIALVPDK